MMVGRRDEDASDIRVHVLTTGGGLAHVKQETNGFYVLSLLCAPPARRRGLMSVELHPETASSTNYVHNITNRHPY
jgi:hypothetical protein